MRYSFCKQTNEFPLFPTFFSIHNTKNLPRVEKQGTRKPRERQKTNKMSDCAWLKAESQVFLIINRLCLRPQDVVCDDGEAAVRAGGGGGHVPPNSQKTREHLAQHPIFGPAPVTMTQAINLSPVSTVNYKCKLQPNSF